MASFKDYEKKPLALVFPDYPRTGTGGDLDRLQRPETWPGVQCFVKRPYEKGRPDCGVVRVCAGKLLFVALSGPGFGGPAEPCTAEELLAAGWVVD